MKTKSIVSYLIAALIIFSFSAINFIHADDLNSGIENEFACPMDSGEISVQFGVRTHPILNKKFLHSGIDIKAAKGTLVHASEKGEVIFAEYNGGYGRSIKIKHNNGYISIYGHLHKIMVTVGQQVEKDEQIGLVGKTGLTKEPCLHLEIRKDDEPINPIELINFDILPK